MDILLNISGGAVVALPARRASASAISAHAVITAVVGANQLVATSPPPAWVTSAQPVVAHPIARAVVHTNTLAAVIPCKTDVALASHPLNANSVARALVRADALAAILAREAFLTTAQARHASSLAAACVGTQQRCAVETRPTLRAVTSACPANTDTRAVLGAGLLIALGASPPKVTITLVIVQTSPMPAATVGAPESSASNSNIVIVANASASVAKAVP